MYFCNPAEKEEKFTEKFNEFCKKFTQLERIALPEDATLAGAFPYLLQLKSLSIRCYNSVMNLRENCPKLEEFHAACYVCISMKYWFIFRVKV